MKQCLSTWSIFVACCLLILPMLFIACEYKDKPDVIFDPTAANDTSNSPTITGIVPATKALGGVREITIVGANLGLNGGDTNWVYIGGAQSIIKEIQNSSITVYRPKLSNDRYDINIIVSITNPKVMRNSSNINYSMESPGVVVGDYADARFGTILAAECDNQASENIFSTYKNFMYKTDFAGVTQTTILNAANILSGDYASITAMAFGPGAYEKNLFIADGKSYIARMFIADTIVGKNKYIPVRLTVPAAVSQLDFDEKGNLYVAGNGNIFVADSSVGTGTAPTFTTMTGYAGGANIVKIRVVKESGNNYLYVADSLGVWKSQIVGNSLTNSTQLVNLVSTALSNCRISSFELDEHNSLFLCLKYDPKYSLFIRENDGSITPFYNDSNILPKTVDKLMWGNSKYLYLISSSLSGSGKIYRMTLDRNGAPYYGRTFIR